MGLTNRGGISEALDTDVFRKGGNKMGRVTDILTKLTHEKNSYCLRSLPAWIDDSMDYANRMVEEYGFNSVQDTYEGYRVLFVMNKICPNLHHFKRLPSFRPICTEDLRGYNRMTQEYMLENTQAGFSKDGVTIQESVRYTPEEWLEIESFAAGNCFS